MSNNPLFTQIKNLLDQCEEGADFEGNIPIVMETAVVRSYSISYACYRARKAGGTPLLESVCRQMPLSPKVGGNYARVWEHFYDLILDGDNLRFPRLSFSYFATLYTYGLRGSKAARLIEVADDREWKIPHFERKVKEIVNG